MLLRNPADSKGGFWLTCLVDDIVYKVGSNEITKTSLIHHDHENQVVRIALNHCLDNNDSSLVRSDISMWSYNTPILLIRYELTNMSKKRIEDLKLYSIMDFDIGGSSSYKDDFGSYEQETGILIAYDENPLFVAMTSQPGPDAWEFNSPIKLRIDEEYRDLNKTLQLGPKDIATALQWNLGNLDSGKNRIVDVVLSASNHLDDAKMLIEKAWKIFGKKIR